MVYGKITHGRNCFRVENRRTRNVTDDRRHDASSKEDDGVPILGNCLVGLRAKITISDVDSCCHYSLNELPVVGAWAAVALGRKHSELRRFPACISGGHKPGVGKTDPK